MIKASSCSRGRTSGTVFGKRGSNATFLRNMAVRNRAISHVRFPAFRRLMALALLSILVSACVSPSPSGEVAQASVLEVQQGTADTGLPLRWGGTITRVQNKQDLTILEIVSRPLLRSGRPRHNDKTDGRFLAEISGFIDPEIIGPGRDVSLVGTVVRVEKGQVGEADYQYPVMSVFNYRFWDELNEPDTYYRGYPYYYPHDRFWYDWPHRRRGRISGKLIY